MAPRGLASSRGEGYALSRDIRPGFVAAAELSPGGRVVKDQQEAIMLLTKNWLVGGPDHSLLSALVRQASSRSGELMRSDRDVHSSHEHREVGNY